MLAHIRGSPWCNYSVATLATYSTKMPSSANGFSDYGILPLLLCFLSYKYQSILNRVGQIVFMLPCTK
jgi:hypothetical protein